ncbi:MAG: hypothetical protein HZY76_08495 [Anaerolineae bacterium]|nr:MAG: hypothetical protein HZY76_08495 [Anaerolineae bacterium]
MRLRVPGRIRIDVTERTPAIIWQTAQGTAWVDRTGVALPPLAQAPTRAAAGDRRTWRRCRAVAGRHDGAGTGGLPVVHMQAPLVAALLGLEELLPDTLAYQYDAQNGLNFRSREGTQVILVCAVICRPN